MVNVFYLLCIVCLLLSNITKAEVNPVTSDTTLTKHKLFSKFIPYPAFGNLPETGISLGLGVIRPFFVHESSSRPSYISSYNAVSVKKQIEFSLSGSVWFPKNYNLVFETVYNSFPKEYYGIGNNTKASDKEIIRNNLFKFKSNVSKEVYENIYIGFGLWYENNQFNTDESNYMFTYNTPGSKGGNTYMIGYRLAYDSRDYENSTTKGLYIAFQGWQGIGDYNYKYSLYDLDSRYFIKINNKQTLGAQALFKTARGQNVPFYYLPSLGGDDYLRGYYATRYVDSNMLLFQLEYRVDPWNDLPDNGILSVSRLSFATFASSGKVFDNGDYGSEEFKPSWGAGLRYRFDPKSRMVLRFDYAVGNKPEGEKRFNGFYIVMNEAF